ncbi:hypothetical protein KY290_007940 [Solanum tuberosum]|uniref:Uncharacterized protein n=1 Tax=Solanum tuberosum TaxID=4113 RepID=A0ABQ7W760_SOLTU|nr:hypothetical protein KY290_007940 [Solanum tuberosum]
MPREPHSNDECFQGMYDNERRDDIRIICGPTDATSEPILPINTRRSCGGDSNPSHENC